MSKKHTSEWAINENDFQPNMKDYGSYIQKMDYIDFGDIKESKSDIEAPGKMKRLLVACAYNNQLLVQHYLCKDNGKRSWKLRDDRIYCCKYDDTKLCQPFLCTDEECKPCNNIKKLSPSPVKRYVQDKYIYCDNNESFQVILKLTQNRYKCQNRRHSLYHWPWDMTIRKTSKEDGYDSPFQYGSKEPYEIDPDYSMTRRAHEQCVKEAVEYNVDHAVGRYDIGPEYLKKKIRKTTGIAGQMFKTCTEYQIKDPPLILFVLFTQLHNDGEYLFFLDEHGYVLDMVRNDSHRYNLIEGIKHRFINREKVGYIFMDPDPALAKIMERELFTESTILFLPWRLPEKLKALELFWGKNRSADIQKMRERYLKKCKDYGIDNPSVFNDFSQIWLDRSKDLTKAFIAMAAYMNEADKELSVDYLRLKYCGWQTVEERSEYCQHERENTALTAFGIERLHRANPDLAVMSMLWMDTLFTADAVVKATTIPDGRRVNVFCFWQYFPYVDYDVLTEENINLAEWKSWLKTDEFDLTDRMIQEYAWSGTLNGYRSDNWMIGKFEREMAELAHYREQLQNGSVLADNEHMNSRVVCFGHYAGQHIEWYEIYSDNEFSLLLSKYGLDAIPFDTENTMAVWENCSLRKWLNDEFYNMAFTHEEQYQIISKGRDDCPFSTPECASERMVLGDKVFLIDETHFIYEEGVQICYPTEYATEHGAHVDQNKATKWWIRESWKEFYKESGPFCLNGEGALCKVDATATDICIRPAICIKKMR